MPSHPPQESKSEYSGPASDAAGSRVSAKTPSQETSSSSLLPGSLIEVGFWADPRDPHDDRPHPAALVDHVWGKTNVSRAVAMYISSGFLESFELGYSFCRIGHGCPEATPGSPPRDVNHAPVMTPVQGRGGSVAMGCCTLTDGRYVWPEGLAHYVTCHAVRPPEEFISHAVKNLGALRKAQARGRLRWSPENGGRTVALEPETAVFLRDRTTLGIALLPEPETLGDTARLCSCVPS